MSDDPTTPAAALARIQFVPKGAGGCYHPDTRALPRWWKWRDSGILLNDDGEVDVEAAAVLAARILDVNRGDILEISVDASENVCGPLESPRICFLIDFYPIHSVS